MSQFRSKRRRALVRVLPCALVALLGQGVALRAQQGSPSQATKDAIQKLAFMVGEWEGEGWIQRGPGPRQEFHGRETVRLTLGGAALLIEGVHEAKGDAPDAKPVVVHNALGVMTTAGDGKDGYRFNTWLADGRSGQHRAEWRDGKLYWTMENPRAGTIRYTIWLDEKGRWAEIGEVSRDGKNWMQFFAMTLTKKDLTKKDLTKKPAAARG